jgi:hypothetical protein
MGGVGEGYEEHVPQRKMKGWRVSILKMAIKVNGSKGSNIHGMADRISLGGEEGV